MGAAAPCVRTARLLLTIEKPFSVSTPAKGRDAAQSSSTVGMLAVLSPCTKRSSGCCMSTSGAL
jgi:hypothetical protein